VAELFDALCETPPASWEAELAHRTDDVALRIEVMSLLRASQEVGERFDRHPVLDAADDDAPPMIGRRIGAYRVLRELGRGGMGAVWEAERADGTYQKHVAIKMIPTGLATSQLLQQFRRERELLAGLAHRNIATLLDGGVTDDGVPWFAMEYIDGQPIDQWCNARALPIPARIDLFRQVCSAVQHAHEHLVIHRDLKPCNILVASDGTVKLLDFGISSIIAADPGARTATGVTPLTAAYASPEQLRGDRVTTATDVYSLGVVLFELLTGTRPAAGPQAGHTITAPSRLVSDHTAARFGEANSRRAAQQLRGDIDSIVLMALRPDPDRRYRSAQQLGDDLQRARLHQTVTARPDTFAYRTRMLIRRNRAASAIATVATAALLAATLVTWHQGAVAKRERDHAILEAQRTRQVTQFFQDVLSTPKPGETSHDITVVQAIDAMIPRIDSIFLTHPDLRAAIKNTLGSTLHDMGLYERARPLLDDALKVQLSIDGNTPSREQADAYYNLAGVATHTGDPVRGEALYRTALAIYATLGHGDSSEVYHGMNNLSEALHAQGRLAEAATLYGRTAQWLQSHEPAAREARMTALINQATVFSEMGRPAEAEPLLRQVVAGYTDIYGAESEHVGAALQPLAGTLLFERKFTEAETMARRALAIDRAKLGPTNVTTASVMRVLLNILADAGRCDEAIAAADAILALRDKPIPATDASIGTALMYGGWCRAHRGQQAVGERQAREALRLRQGTFPKSHWAIAQAENMLGDVIAQSGPARRAEALRYLQSGYDGLRQTLDSNHVRVQQARRQLDAVKGAAQDR
jgi:serine/threonine-protein kinase